MLINLPAVGLYLRTIRYLRLRQICGQLVNRLRHNHPGAFHTQYLEQMPGIRWADETRVTSPPIGRVYNPGSLLSGVWTFQNSTEVIGFPPDWEVGDVPLLWRYHLHYHDFLWSLEFQDARETALHWISRHPPGRRQVGWESYPLSLRISNWCTLFLGRHRDLTLSDEVFASKLWSSLRDQANHLKRRLEWHLLGNHLFENGIALALAGSCFGHPQASSWRRTGLKVLARELPEQVLADGGHFERSPMYQQRVLRGLQMLVSTHDRDLHDLAQPYIRPLERASAYLCHPDGGIALMNDSAFEGCLPQEDHEREPDSEKPTGPFALTDSGYYGAITEDGHYVVCDAGAIGPDYQPGHGHADLLSFEMSLNGVRVVVDSGVSTYETGAMREYCRSTRAHNTVEIEGQNQVETWASFRVGRRCAPRGVEWKASVNGFRLSAWHDGYRHLPGQPTHARTFLWHEGGVLDISDSVDSTRSVRSDARVHLHPDCQIEALGGDACTVITPGGEVLVSWSGWAEVMEEDSFYCPRFGVEIPNRCLRFSNTVARFRAAIKIAVQ